MLKRMDTVQDRFGDLKCLRNKLCSMDESCDQAREMVIQSARDLVSRISEHERRLLNEIETFRETQYKKCHTTCGEFHRFMQEVQERKARIDDDKSGDQSDRSTSLEQLERKLEQEDWSSNHNIKCVTFSHIRCNTAFGSIDILPGSVRAVTSPKTNRSLSVGVMSPSLSLPLDLPRPRSSSLAISNLTLISDDSSAHSSDHIENSSWNDMRKLETPEEQDVTRHCMVWKVSTEGCRLGEISCPNDVLFLEDGSIVVSDRDNLRLQKFSACGVPTGILAQGAIKPRRITLQQDGNIAVTDTQQNCIKVISPQGDFIRVISNKKMKHSFKCPCGISTNSKGQYIISDLEKHMVTVYNKDGKPSKNLQNHGTTSSEFKSPSYLITDENDRLYISDNWYQSVLVFDKNYKFLFEMSTTDPEQGQHLKYPNGISVDESGDIFIADWGNHTVSMFSSDGKFIRHILTKKDHILHPAGIAVRNGLIAITEYSDNHSSIGIYRIYKEDDA